jgi:ketosteroid isomerase-like protein
MRAIDRNTIYASCICALAMMASPSWCADSRPVPTSVAGLSSDSAMRAGVKTAFAQFVAAQNARDASVLSGVLVKSHEFVWAQYGGQSIWGFNDAMAAWKSAWNGSWHLDPQLNELRISRIAPDVALLITPLLLTSGDPGEQPSTDPVRWAGVFVRNASGWRLSSLIITPYPNWGKP